MQTVLPAGPHSGSCAGGPQGQGGGARHWWGQGKLWKEDREERCIVNQDSGVCLTWAVICGRRGGGDPQRGWPHLPALVLHLCPSSPLSHLSAQPPCRVQQPAQPGLKCASRRHRTQAAGQRGPLRIEARISHPWLPSGPPRSGNRPPSSVVPRTLRFYALFQNNGS